MKLAVIETGGKQYIVKPNDKIAVEKLAGEKDGKIAFDKVLLIIDGEKVEIGAPYLSGKSVEGKIINQARSRKVLIMKYHNKTRYRRKKGHRQSLTNVEITKV